MQKELEWAVSLALTLAEAEKDGHILTPTQRDLLLMANEINRLREENHWLTHLRRKMSDVVTVADQFGALSKLDQNKRLFVCYDDASFGKFTVPVKEVVETVLFNTGGLYDFTPLLPYEEEDCVILFV